MEPDRYAALDARVTRLEQLAATLRADLEAARAGAPTADPLRSPVVREAPFAAPLPSAPAAPPSLERLVAGRGLQLAGLVLTLLGVALFLNLAFAHGWIGPAERILLGLVGGGALLGFGASRTRPEDVTLAESLIALGAGIVDLALWAAVDVFPSLHVPRPAAFLAFVAVTATLAVLAYLRRSERIALLGIVGGFATPVLLATAQPDRPALLAYLLILGAAFGALSLRMRFAAAEAAAFVASAAYLAAFAPAAGWTPAEALGAGAAICGLYAVVLTLAALRGGPVVNRLALLSLDALAFALMAAAVVFPTGGTPLGLTLLALAAICCVAALVRALPKPVRLTYAYLALTAATLALPALLHAFELLDALTLEGAVIAVIATVNHDRRLAVTAAALLALVSLWDVWDAIAGPPIGAPLSALTVSLALVVAALAFVHTRALRSGAFGDAEQVWNGIASVATHVVAVVAITRVLLDSFGGKHWDIAVPSHAQVAVSVAWTLYAAALFGWGLRRDFALARWEGLALFALTILKVFAIDLGNVDVAWRIASFVVLGVVCTGASAWYMRAQGGRRASEAQA